MKVSNDAATPTGINDLAGTRQVKKQPDESPGWLSITERVLPPSQAGGEFKPLRSQGQNPEQAIPFALSSYLELVDWTGRIVRSDKKGRIPADTPPILGRLKIDPDEWLKTMCWDNRFGRAIGKLAALKAYAEQAGKQWIHGVGCSQSLYRQ